MKRVALRFVRPEIDAIKTFALACDEIKNKTAQYSFTFIVPHNLVSFLLDEVQNFGFTSLQEVKERGTSFDETIECTAVLVKIDSSKRMIHAMRHIAKHIDLMSVRDRRIHAIEDGIIIEGVHDPCDGYGAACENMVLALEKITDVTFIPRHEGPSPHLAHPHMTLAMSGSRLKENFLYFLAPLEDTANDGIPKSPTAKKFLLTMFEASRLPLTWPGRINHVFDKLLVPCTFCKEVAERGGITIPIDVLKLGVRVDTFQYRQRTPPTDRPYRFLFLFANHALTDNRKNGVLVLEAFNEAFRNRKDVELIVKVSGQVHSRLNRYFCDNIKLINKRASIEEIASLYHNCDCFLFPSRGEGYAMPPREAMATGMPVIITDYSAMTDIAKPSISYPLEPYKLVPAVYPRAEANRHNNGNPLFGEWADIRLDQLIYAMKHVVANQDEAVRIGTNAAAYILENETTDITARQLLTYFDEFTK